MDFLYQLWLPMLLSAVALQIASTIAWTVAPHHNKDWKKLPNEDEVMSALRKLGTPPAGTYLFPYVCHGPEMNTPEFKEKYTAGPRGVITFWEMPNMGANIAWTFVFFVVTIFTIAYVAFAALGSGASFSKVFQIVGTIAILTYSAAGIPNAIWFKRPIITNLIDGVAYGLIAGCIFAALWPR
jgi:hypothetical protein